MSEQRVEKEQFNEPDNRFPVAISGTAGERLKSARESLSISLESVADALKISVRQIGFIENDQWTSFPAPAIAKGFVRSYAKLLGLNPDELVSLLPVDYVVVNLARELKPTLETPFLESKTRYLGKTDSGNRKYLLGAVLMAIAAIVFVVYQFAERAGYLKNFVSSGHTVIETAASLPENSAAELPKSDVVPEKKLSVIENFSPVSSSIPQSNAGSAIAEDRASQAQLQNDRLPENQLQILSREDSWIQVKRKNGTVIYSKLLKAGSKEVFDVNDGLYIKVGNAKGVDLNLNGKKYEFSVSPETNVANLFVE